MTPDQEITLTVIGCTVMILLLIGAVIYGLFMAYRSERNHQIEIDNLKHKHENDHN